MNQTAQRGRGVLLHRLVGLFVSDLRQVWINGQCTVNPFGGGYRMDIHVTPALIWTPWQRSTLATIPELGIVTRAGSIGVEWWTWRFLITYGLSTQKPNNKVSGPEPAAKGTP